MTLRSLNQTAGSIMSSPPVVISEEATLVEAARIMVKNRIGCLPVVNAGGNFAGMITERTFQVALAGVKPDSAMSPDQRLFEELFVYGSDGMSPVQEKFLESKHTAVEDAMLLDEPTVTRDTPVWRVAELLMGSHLSHIAVVEDGKPVGVIARHDLLRAYLAGAPR